MLSGVVADILCEAYFKSNLGNSDEFGKLTDIVTEAWSKKQESFVEEE